MKKIVALILLFFAFTFAFAQERTIEIDYTVDYLIPNRKKGTKDTISIGFNKDGKYLWTNYNNLAQDFARSVVKNPELAAKANTNIVFDTEKGDLIMAFNIESNTMYFNMDLGMILPINANEANEESFVLISNQLIDKETVNGKELEVYEIYPENKPNDKISMIADNDYPVNNSLIFGKLFEIIFRVISNDSEIPTNFPTGLITQLKVDSEIMLEAIKINPTKKTIKLNYSLEIKE